MEKSTSSAAGPGQVEVLINPEDKQLKTVAHSLLESKLEKMLSSAAASEADPRHTRKLAIDWIWHWDLDGDGIISELELKGAALQHAKLQINFKRRGGWLVGLVILAICCFFVILGLSVWANDVSQESKGASGRSDLGGFTLRAKDSPAVVKTGTALYEFLLQRAGYLPFDELSQITGIGFTYRRALYFMDIEGFQWFGSGNVTFFSPRGVVISVARPTETTVLVTFQEPGDAVPRIIARGLEQFLGYEQFVDGGIARLRNMSVPVTVDNMFKYFWTPTVVSWVQASRLPDECVNSGLAWFNGSTTVMPHETCATALLMFLQGTGVMEGAVGPQDYYGTKMTKEEADGLTGPLVYTKGGVFEPDILSFESKVRRYTQSRINAMTKSR